MSRIMKIDRISIFKALPLVRGLFRIAVENGHSEEVADLLNDLGIKYTIEEEK